MKIANVCFLLKDNQVLLAMKKRGFGEGKWNGAGGKVKEGETVEEAMVREAKEEIGVDIEIADLEKVAELEFNFPDKKDDDWGAFVHAYMVRVWKGEPSESEEMRPVWFDLDKIPFDEMWADYTYWFKRALGGEKLKAQFYFKGSGESVARYNTKTVSGF